MAAALVLLAACSGADSGGSSKGTLKYGLDFTNQFGGHFDTAVSQSNCDALLMAPIYGALINLDPSGNLQPGEVQSWDISSDGLTITLHVRPGQTFTDGTTFDANAVKAGLKHNQLNTDQLNSLSHITSFDVVNSTTLKLGLDSPTALLVLYTLASGRGGYIIASNSLNSADKKPVGAGPYEFVSYSAGSDFKIRKNPHYWEASKFDVPNIDFVNVGVGPPSVTALQSNAVDYVQVQPEGYNALKGNKTYKVAIQPSKAYLQFEFRQTKPFDNVKVRQAVEYALNREELNKVVNFGAGEVASQQFPKGSPGYNSSIADMYKYDPATARRLLAEAGYPNGFTMGMVIPGGNIANMERQGALVQQELAAVGIKVTIQRINGADIATGYYTEKNGNAFAAEELGDPYLPNKIYDNFGKGQFVAIYDNAENQQLTDLSKDAFKQTDAKQLAAIVQNGEKIVMQDALDVPIAFVPQFAGYNSSRVSGTVRAQTDICDPVDLRGMKLK